jgi:biopolymer transport protein ExbD
MAVAPYSAQVQLNLTPILDMVFQLITFFLLVINFHSASLEQNLSLPAVGSARPIDTHGYNDVLILNIDAQGQLIVYGQTKDIDRYLLGEAQASLLKARAQNPDLQAGDELPSIVVLRADRRTPFKLLNRVITTCQRHGFRQFSLKTAPQVKVAHAS